jgi:3-phenylpropionate/trans-cinnamate dioxygenase ferredoxin subunit
MSYVDVGAVEGFSDGKPRVVSVNAREIAIVLWGGKWYALRNICPHLGARVCEGPLRPLLHQPSVTDEDLTVDLDRPVIMCPWHHWEFDVTTGEALTGRERVKTYRVRVEGGRVKVEVERPSAVKVSEPVISSSQPS